MDFSSSHFLALSRPAWPMQRSLPPRQLQGVLPRSAAQTVLPALAGQRVVAAKAHQAVGVRGAREGVLARGADTVHDHSLTQNPLVRPDVTVPGQAALIRRRAGGPTRARSGRIPRVDGRRSI
jgi:hypothetical protein